MDVPDVLPSCRLFTSSTLLANFMTFPSQSLENSLRILYHDVSGTAALLPVDTRGTDDLLSYVTHIQLRSVVQQVAEFATVMGGECQHSSRGSGVHGMSLTIVQMSQIPWSTPPAPSFVTVCLVSVGCDSSRCDAVADRTRARSGHA